MPQLIKDGVVCEDVWQTLTEADCESTIPNGQVIVPLAVWQSLGAKSEYLGRNDIGVTIAGETDLTDIGGVITELPVIAVEFPGFMDGRGFSTGRLLRERYQFQGELRAVGQIIRDQFCYLRRCGFNAFQPTNQDNLENAVSSLNDFQEYYQAAVDQPIPLFRRRNA